MTANGFESESLLSYIERMHQRTRRVSVLIPENDIEHSFGEGRFTPGDLVRHLAAINRYMFVENAAGRPNGYPGHRSNLAEGREQVLRFQEQVHAEGMAILRSLPAERFEQSCQTPDGAQIAVWKWLRAMIEHEAHHRGQLYWMLGELGIKTPPLFGLTSEEVRERSKSTHDKSRS